jgi:hypothetical protein
MSSYIVGCVPHRRNYSFESHSLVAANIANGIRGQRRFIEGDPAWIEPARSAKWNTTL